MSRYTFFGDTPPSGLVYNADATAQAHGVTLGFMIGWTPSLTVPRRMIGFRQWITADAVAAGLDLTQTFTYILWAAPNNAQPLYQAAAIARGNVSNLVVGANDFFFPDQYAALVDTTPGNAGRYMLTFYYPPGNAFYSGEPNVIGTGTGFGQTLSTVDPSGALYFWYGPWGSGTPVPQGSWVSYGNPAGVPPQNNLGQGGMTGTTSWYGMDIIVDDISNPTVDKVGITDSITVTRGGLPANVTGTGTATDPLSTVATATDTVTIANVQQPTPIVRACMQSRGCWLGAYPNYSVTGPTFKNDGQPIVVSAKFHVQWDVQFVGCYIFKPPLAAGSIPLYLWKTDGTLLATTTLQWTADAGGWQLVTFDDPVQLFNKDGTVTTPASPNPAIPATNGNAPAPTVDPTINQYMVGYLSPTGDYCYTDWTLGTFAMANGPIVMDTGAAPLAGSNYVYSSIIQMPTVQDWGIYWIDPVVQWVDTSVPPAWGGDVSYFNQWPNGLGTSRFHFPIGVYWPDQTFIAEYATFGVQVIFSGGDDIDGPGYMDAIVAANSEHWPSLSGGGHGSVGQVPNWWLTSTVLQQVATNPAYAALVKAYFIADEPDQGSVSSVPASPDNNNQSGYLSPGVLQQWYSGVRTKDSTRPQLMGLDHISNMCGVFFGEPGNMAGDNVFSESERRKYGKVTDVMGGDWYITYNYGCPNGIWNQAQWVHRLREITDDRIPIIADLETAPGDGSLFGPTGYASIIEKAFWANVIAGCWGIGLFDHWFPPASGGPHQMDNYMLQVDGPTYGGDDSVRQKILAIFNFKETLGSAMVPKDLGLVTAYTSSNQTAGPVGGVTGVPIHYTTRSDGTHHYLFAQGIRPGATTATITMPSVPSTTLTVLNESRTVTTDASGTFTDTFAADYSFHIYRW